MKIAKKIAPFIATVLCSMTTNCVACSNSPQLHGVHDEHLLLRKRRQLWKPPIDSKNAYSKEQERQQENQTEERTYTRLLSVTWSGFGGTIEGSAEGGEFGTSLALSANGRVVAGGAPEATTAETGKVQLHRFVSGQWTSIGQIDGTAGQQENFGRSVALSWDGTKLIVGAPKASGTGRARAYKYDSGTETWSKLGQDLTGPASLAGSAQFGQTVTMNAGGDVVCIGAPKADNDRGLVRVFKYSETDGTWSAMGQVIYGQSPGDVAGFSLGLSYKGNVLAIGFPTRMKGELVMVGQVQIYRYSEEDGAWSQIGQSIVGELEYEQLGYALSLSANGMRIAIGSPRKTDDANVPNKGAVQAFQYNGSNNQWQQIGNTIFGDDRSDILGASLSLSAAGNQISVLKVVGEEVGYYSLEGGQWTQVGNIINGDTNPNRVILSADGNKIAVGDSNTQNGNIQVYSFAGNLYDITLAHVEATFTDAEENVPEVELIYVNSEPPGTGYHKLRILDPDCTIIDTTNAITPVLNAAGTVIATNPGSSIIDAKINIDASLIQDTVYYFEGEDLGSGKIQFCAKIDFYEQQDQSVVTESSLITLQLDQTALWELAGVDGGDGDGDGGGAPRPPLETIRYVSFDFTIEAYLCDYTNEEVVPHPLYPGQSMQMCVRTPAGSEVEVMDLRAVAFKNDLVPQLTIDVVDEDGNSKNDVTSVTCSNGICRLKTFTFSNLYEYDVEGDGTLEDVTDGVKLQGMAILGFPSANGDRSLYRVQTPPLQNLQQEQEQEQEPAQETTTTRNNGTTFLHIDNPDTTEAQQANTDEDLREVIGSNSEMAETSFAMDVALQKPPKRDNGSSAPIHSLLLSSCLAAGASFAASIATNMS